MFKRPHHQKILKLLESINVDLFNETKCYFGGGTAISLLLNEYRESVDVDFLCADKEGYGELRNLIDNNNAQNYFTKNVQQIRGVRTDQYGIRTAFLIDGTPIKFEIINENKIQLEGRNTPFFPVACLTQESMFAEKILANADRYNDKGVHSRDIIDFMIMEYNWGKAPSGAWDQAKEAYKETAVASIQKAKDVLKNDHRYFYDCVKELKIDDSTTQILKTALLGKNNLFRPKM